VRDGDCVPRVRYYPACKLALIGSTLLAPLQAPVPFTPIQIILMELFMDLAAAAAFVVERPESRLMSLPPRSPGSRFMDRDMVAGIVCAAGEFRDRNWLGISRAGRLDKRMIIPRGQLGKTQQKPDHRPDLTVVVGG
jgi:hypothetical protein